MTRTTAAAEPTFPPRERRQEPIGPASRRVVPNELRTIAVELRKRHGKEAREEILDVRRRIEVGHQRIREAEHDGRDRRPLIKRLSELEGRLVNLERDYEVPILIVTALADLLCGLEHRVPGGSLMRIRLPGAVDVTVELDGVPL